MPSDGRRMRKKKEKIDPYIIRQLEKTLQDHFKK